MDTVVVSATFQIRIPKSIRRSLALKPGQPLRIAQYGQRIELVPLRPLFESPRLFGEPPSGDGSGEEEKAALRGVAIP